MKSIKILALSGFAVLAGLTFGAGSAYAAPGYCVPGAGAPYNVLQTDLLSVTDVDFRTVDSDNCYGVVLDNITADGNGGSDGPTEINAIWGNFPGYGTGSFVGLESGSSIVAGGTTFSLANTGGNATSGTWTLTATGGLPRTLDIVVVTKASDRYATYFFNDELFTAAQSGVGQLGTFEIHYLNNGNQTPGLSHLLVFLRNGTSSVPGGGGEPQTLVPEPASLLLLGSGLAAAAWRARRKKTATTV